jgi:N-methylhydantoinase A
LEQPVELVNLRAVGAGQVEKVQLPSFEMEGPDASDAVIEQHRVFFDGGFSNANIYDRNLLRAGHHLSGPAIVTQIDSTTVIHPGHVGIVDRYLNILISSVGEQATAIGGQERT